MIVVIDYGAGNLRSVEKALKSLGHPVIVTQDKTAIKTASGIILPGVGSFDVAVNNLRKSNLESAVIESIALGKPYLGICLGLQILFNESEEGKSKGFGILPGKVKKFNFKGHPLAKKLKVPHMGWNSAVIKKESPIFEGMESGSLLYFVHSYYVEPEDKDLIATTTEYGSEFTSSITKDNIYGTQFHVEKSGKIGLKILDNFAKLCKKV
ncbi:imidazole glycerol phosphate synthase subunit HisH [Candidatus Margulisiibacteriota bacterium]